MGSGGRRWGRAAVLRQGEGEEGEEGEEEEEEGRPPPLWGRRRGNGPGAAAALPRALRPGTRRGSEGEPTAGEAPPEPPLSARVAGSAGTRSGASGNGARAAPARRGRERRRGLSSEREGKKSAEEAGMEALISCEPFKHAQLYIFYFMEKIYSVASAKKV